MFLFYVRIAKSGMYEPVIQQRNVLSAPPVCTNRQVAVLEEARGSWRGIDASIEQAGMDVSVVERRVSQRKPSPGVSLQCKGSRLSQVGVGNDCVRIGSVQHG